MADTAVAKHGRHGLTVEQESMLTDCVEVFGDTWFTVSMYCIKASADAVKCIEILAHLHACGCVRKPVNDGGQEYYQVMPSIVYPNKTRGQ